MPYDLLSTKLKIQKAFDKETFHYRKKITDKTFNKSSYVIKGKAIPLQALTDPEGSRRLRLPDFKTIGT
jgi:hypothetical protein